MKGGDRLRQFTSSQIFSIDKGGITISAEEGDFRIVFEECTRNLGFEWHVKPHNCVGTRDISLFVFTFFTKPKVEVLVEKKGFWREILFPEKRRRAFHHISKAIHECGYTTFDLP